jgi:assimilatory nitrate reductase catalytic subunit
LIARRAGEAAGAEVAGDASHPSNFGRLCSKGAALADTLGLENRLLHPRIRERAGAERASLEHASWERALDRVAEGFLRIAREHGPEAVAFYVSGQLLTEDYYVANKLMKGFIGGANIDTNSRLCMASAVAGHRLAFGGDLVPGCYEDFELADLVVLVGSNTAWCHPVLFQRIAEAKARRPQLRIVVIDPRRTSTCEIADLHLPIRPGTDVWLFNGLLAYLHRNGCADAEFVAKHTSGAAQALATAETSTADATELGRTCGIDPGRIETFFRIFANTPRVVTAFSQGVNQSTAGTDKVLSILNCHLLTARIGRPGMGPFSITGQPNAMGGREVGGMASQLAAHMEIENAAHRRIVQQFWASPRIADRPGLKAVELFEAIHAGRVRAVWIMATNPAVSLPDADRVREALARCELVVVSDCEADTETARLAHVLLPALAWGEKDGTVTSSERRISRQRAFLPAPGEARPDWWIVCEVAKRMGFGRYFDYAAPHEIFDEHARLSCTENDGSRMFDIGGLAGLTRERYDALEPVQWPVRSSAGRGPLVDRDDAKGVARLFTDGRFMHADRRARFVPTPPRAPAHAPDGEFPMVLNTGRIRDQWHTMTRTGRSSRLAEHRPEPFIDLNGQDALVAGVREGELARTVTRWGSMIGRVRTSGEMARGHVFVPMHWSAVVASDARAGALVSPAVDPVSGEPELKHTPAHIEPFHVDWFGVVASRRPIGGPKVAWWTLVRGEGWLRYELAGRGVPGAGADSTDWAEWARRLIGVPDDEEDFLDYFDEGSSIYRAAHLVGERLEACVYVSRRPELPARRWLASLFARPAIPDRDRAALLAGRPLASDAASTGAASDSGPLVCSCFAVGREAIASAIRAHGLRDVREVGARLKAGTNCGSCLPEIRALLAESASALSPSIQTAARGALSI